MVGINKNCIRCSGGKLGCVLSSRSVDSSTGDMSEGVNYVTLTQYIEVGERTLLVLPTHILPHNRSLHTESSPCDESSNATGVIHEAYANLAEQKRLHYAWFNDHFNQEVMVCVHEVISTKAIENLLCHRTQSKPGSAASKPAYEFRRSDNLRMVFTLKPINHRQHMLFPNQTGNDQVLLRRAAFISEYGRRVLPCLDAYTYGGAGYTSYRVLPEALHVYVDNFELTSYHGIFKMLCLLNPKHKIATDIPSYFKQMAEDKPPEVLPQAPVPGLKRRFYDRSAKSSSLITKIKGANVKQEAKSRPQQQSTILQAFANYQQCVEQKEAHEVSLPDDILEGVWDFDSSQPSPPVSKMEDICQEGDTCNTDLFQPQSNDKQRMTTSFDQNMPALSTELKGKKRQRLATANSSCSIAAKNKKAKIYHVPPAVEQQSEQNQPDIKCEFNDPFDELLADQTKARNKPDTKIHVNKRRRKKLEDADDEDIDVSYLKANLKPDTSSAEVDENMISANSLATGDSTAKDIDIDDILFDVSTPDITLSPAESFEAEKDLASRLQQSEGFDVPMLARRSASQPVPHLLSTEQERATSLTKTQCFSDSVPESEFNIKFGNITNTITSSAEHGETSSGKVSGRVSIERSNLTKDLVSKERQCSNRVEKKKKKPLPKSAAEIFEGAKNVADLTHQQLSDWMRLNHPVLMNIFKRKQYSWRHEEFNTNPKMRAAMKWRYDSRRFTGDQVKLITDVLLKIFCWRHMKYFNYVMSVLLPECLVRVIADVHEVTFEEAEELMFNFQGQARVDLTSANFN